MGAVIILQEEPVTSSAAKMGAQLEAAIYDRGHRVERITGMATSSIVSRSLDDGLLPVAWDGVVVIAETWPAQHVAALANAFGFRPKTMRFAVANRMRVSDFGQPIDMYFPANKFDARRIGVHVCDVVEGIADPVNPYHDWVVARGMRRATAPSSVVTQEYAPTLALFRRAVGA